MQAGRGCTRPAGVWMLSPGPGGVVKQQLVAGRARLVAYILQQFAGEIRPCPAGPGRQMVHPYYNTKTIYYEVLSTRFISKHMEDV